MVPASRESQGRVDDQGVRYRMDRVAARVMIVSATRVTRASRAGSKEEGRFGLACEIIMAGDGALVGDRAHDK